jgi:hypothetical protein
MYLHGNIASAGFMTYQKGAHVDASSVFFSVTGHLLTRKIILRHVEVTKYFL